MLKKVEPESGPTSNIMDTFRSPLFFSQSLDLSLKKVSMIFEVNGPASWSHFLEHNTPHQYITCVYIYDNDTKLIGTVSRKLTPMLLYINGKLSL